MTTKNGNEFEAEISDEDTAELPVLVLHEADGDSEPAADPEPAADQPPSPEASDPTVESWASDWVSGMEAEIEWLQERMRTLDRELHASEERAGKLRAESDDKDQAIAGLNAEIARQRTDADALNAAVREREASLASLESALAQRDAKLAEQSEALDAARRQTAVLEDRLQFAFKERDELSRSVGDEKTRLIEVSTRTDAMSATNERQAMRIQDLENYIEGRRDRWSALNQELESGKARLRELEAAVATGEKRLEERESRIETQSERIVELERLRSEAEGRHKERESAYRDAQTRLAEQLAEIERLRAAMRDKESGANSDAAGRHAIEIDSLKQTVAARGETIRKLEIELEKRTALNEHMESRSAEERERIGELQRELAELGAERGRLTENLEAARGDADALRQKLTELEAGLEELEAENARRQSTIAGLEAELANKSKIIGAFDRNADRMLTLRQNLHSLSGDEGAAAGEQTTKRASDRTGGDRDKAGRAFASNPAKVSRRMIVPLNAADSATTRYALSKPVVTVGRSKASDIRILDAVVSRVHARLTTDNEITIIEDMGSKNGVFVNSRLVDRAVLQHGDVISFGENRDFRYVETGHAAH